MNRAENVKREFLILPEFLILLCAAVSANALRMGLPTEPVTLNAEQLSELNRKLSNMSHDVRNSLSLIVASAHNMPVESYPWRFSSVISVGSHEEPDPFAYYYNPSPPVEFFGKGVDVDVPWLDGTVLNCSGNSFATPHIAGICALIRSKHPELTPFQVKTVLHLTSTNVQETGG